MPDYEDEIKEIQELDSLHAAGTATAQKICKTIKAEKNSLTIRALVDIAGGRLHEKSTCINLLMWKARKQEQKIKAFSLGRLDIDTTAEQVKSSLERHMLELRQNNFYLYDVTKIATVSNSSPVTQGIIAVRRRIRLLSDDALCQELQSAVEAIGDESLLKSADELGDILKLHTKKIVNLLRTIDTQGTRLQELEKESVEADLEDLELVSADSSMPLKRELKRKEMGSSESINIPRNKRAKVYISPLQAEYRRVDLLSDEEFIQELSSTAEKMGMGNSLAKSAVELVDTHKLLNEKIVNFRSTIESQGKKLQELRWQKNRWSGVSKPWSWAQADSKVNTPAWKGLSEELDEVQQLFDAGFEAASNGLNETYCLNEIGSNDVIMVLFGRGTARLLGKKDTASELATEVQKQEKEIETISCGKAQELEVLPVPSQKLHGRLTSQVPHKTYNLCV